jgi:hypothetical protein
VDRSPLWTSIAAAVLTAPLAVLTAPLAVLAFLLLHQWWISDVWSSAGQGLMMSAVAAIAFGTAYHFTDARRSPVLFGVALWIGIAPPVIVMLWGRTGLEVEFGATAGWLAMRTRAAAVSAAVAAFAMVFISGPSPSFVRTERGLKIYLALLPLVVIYVWCMAALARVLAARQYSARA